MSRVRLLPLLSIAVLLAAASQAHAGVVSVTGMDGAVHDVDLAGLPPDVDARAYAVRDGAGETARTVTGVSLPAVLAAAGVDEFLLGYVELARPDGGALLMSGRAATAAGGDGPPAFYEDAAGLHFVRPSTGAGDANAADELVAAGGRLALSAHDGKLLEVRLEASSRRIEPGGRVTLTASVEREAAGEPVAYSWSFDDGSRRGRGRSVTHRFERRGQYDVAVGATSPTDDAGAAGVVTIQVGAPGDGPDRKGGGTDADADAPDSGVAVAAASSGSGGDGDGGERARPAAQPQRRERPAKQRKPVVAAPRDDLVTGELVSAPVEEAPPVAARTGRLRDNPTLAAASASLPAAVWQLGALALLLAAGWAIEMRRPRPPRPE